MGRGLSAILAIAADPDGEREEFCELAVDQVSPNPRQPRRHFDERTLSELSASIAARGMLQPVLVRPLPAGRYELIAGERRWRAAQLAGLELIPAIVRPRADAETLELALIENMVREDLNPVEEAKACAALVEELGLSRAEVGVRVGRGRVAVSNLLRLLELPDEVLDLLESRALSEGHGRALLVATDHDTRKRLARLAAAEGWSVRVLEDQARDANIGADGRGYRRCTMHPDQAQACADIGDALGAALGAEVRVAIGRGGTYRAELRFESPDEALDLARRLRERSVGSVTD